MDYSDLHCAKRRVLRRHDFMIPSERFLLIFSYRGEGRIRHTEATHIECELLVQLYENFHCAPFPRSAS